MNKKYLLAGPAARIRDFLLAALLLSLPLGCRERGYVAVSGYVQGGTYTIKVNLKDVSKEYTADRIKSDVDSIFRLIDTTISGYDSNSIISRFNRGEKVVPNSLFRDVYAASYRYFKETDGSIDCSAAPVFDLWGFGFTRDSLPSESRIDSALSVSGMGRLAEKMPESEIVTSSDLVIDRGNIFSPKLNYNAIGQGYSCDEIADYLYGIGAKDFLVDIGEIYCDGVNPSGRPWSIGVDSPVDGNNSPGAMLKGAFHTDGGKCGIVTSGNYRKFYIHDGRKYAHTIDPRTGMPVEHSLLSATIITGNATDADAYATYCMVIGLEPAKQFILKNPDRISGYLIYDEGGVMKTWYSDNFELTDTGN